MTKEERAARLLRGQNTPSVIERERMAKNILDRVGAKRPKRARLRFGLTVTAAAGAVAALFIALPGKLTPRSGGGGVALEALCQPGPDCHEGSRLLLRVSNYDQAQGYLAAFARRDDGTVIWYFPEDEGGDALPVLDRQWAGRAVVLGEEHTPGEYEVHAVLSTTPIDRSAARTLVERGGDESHVLLTAKVRVSP